MNKKIRILMIDDNRSLIEMAKEYFSSHAVIDIILEAHDGREGLQTILEHEGEYDLVLLDLVMPSKDGLYILDELTRLKKMQNVIVVSGLGKEETLRKVSAYGVKYYILKPFDFEDLESRILESMSVVENKKSVNLNAANLHLLITKTLHSLGIPSHIKGYQYIRESIYLMYENPGLIGGITKELYPEIAIKYETTSSKVERAIRHAIEVSWNRGDYDLMEEIFGHSVDYDRAKPTNSEFIATVADKLRIDTKIYS